jgi:hypothetical protein
VTSPSRGAETGASPSFRRQVIGLTAGSFLTAGLAIGGLWLLAVPVWIATLSWVIVSTRRSAEADLRAGVDRTDWETTMARRIALTFLACFLGGGIVIVIAAVLTAAGR